MRTWLFFCLFLIFGLSIACSILVPQPGIEPMPPVQEGQSLDHRTTREVPGHDFLSKIKCQLSHVQTITDFFSTKFELMTRHSIWWAYSGYVDIEYSVQRTSPRPNPWNPQNMVWKALVKMKLLLYWGTKVSVFSTHFWYLLSHVYVQMLWSTCMGTEL